MPNQALVNYIVQQLNNGFKQEAISQHLINNGYKQQDVQEALTAANATVSQQRTPSTNQPQLQNKAINTPNFQQPQIPQANPQLVSYITQQRNMGFSQEQIKSYLLRYGYGVQQVEPAIDSVFHPNAMNAAANSSHITHLGAVIVSVIVLVSVFSGAGIFFLFNNAGEAPELLDYRLDAAKKLFSPGETLIFEARMDKAAGDDFDVKLTHTIYDNEDNEIESVDETAEAQPRIASRMELPDNLKPGRYKLVSTGIYGEDDSQEVSASFNFEVQAKDGLSTKTDEDKNDKDKIGTPPTTQKPSQLPDKKLVPQPSSSSQTPVDAQPSSQAPSSQQSPQSSQADAPAQPSPQPDEDEQKVSIDKIEADVRVKAADPGRISEADSLCQTLTTQNEKDYCYSDIAEVSKQKQYCDKINHQYRRDVCYLNNFMEQGDYSVCDVIIDIELNLACKEQAKRSVTSAQSSLQATNSSAAAQSSTSQATQDSGVAEPSLSSSSASQITPPVPSAESQPNPDNTTSTTNTDTAADQTA